MRTWLPWFILFVAACSAAQAAPLVPSSELAGRQRERFTPSPLDPFMQPRRPAEPLWRWDCEPTSKPRRPRRSRDC